MNCLVCLVYCCHVCLAKSFDFDSRFCCFGGTPLPEWGRKGSVSIFVCQFKQSTAIKVLQNPQSLPYPSKSYMGKCKHLTQDKCLWDNKPLFSRWSWKRTHLQQNRFYLRWMSLEWGREPDIWWKPMQTCRERAPLWKPLVLSPEPSHCEATVLTKSLSYNWYLTSASLYFGNHELTTVCWKSSAGQT